MNLDKGDVVLVPFPFTELSQTKLRPAIVLYVQPEGEDVTLCFISSQNLDRVSRDELILDPEHPEFTQTELKGKFSYPLTEIDFCRYFICLSDCQEFIQLFF